MGWGEIDTYSKNNFNKTIQKFKNYSGSIFKKREGEIKRREKKNNKKQACAGQNGGWMGEVEGD